MPHAQLVAGSLNTGVEGGIRSIIPGVEPGGSRAGRETKPALLITDVRVSRFELTDAGTGADFTRAEVFLKLSQEPTLIPGLEIPVANVLLAKTATANLWNDIDVLDTFMAQGTIWAPAYIGVVTYLFGFTGGSSDVTIDLDYERVDIPWMDWFIRWDFLDNVVDGDREW